jgi:dTMP kinase
MKGYFISVEGGDGSGKSTQIRKIEAYLQEKGLDYILTREPGGTPVAEKIRELILDPANKALTGRAEMLLYAASRAQHVEEKILPALAEGKVVLSDRFTDSSIAYQAYGRGLGDMVAEVNRIATGGKEPDLTIFLNITPARGMARKNKQDGHELDRLELEKAAFHETVYEGYLALARENNERIANIDADRPIEEVFADIRERLDRLFGF